MEGDSRRDKGDGGRERGDSRRGETEGGIGEMEGGKGEVVEEGKGLSVSKMHFFTSMCNEQNCITRTLRVKVQTIVHDIIATTGRYPYGHAYS